MSTASFVIWSDSATIVTMQQMDVLEILLRTAKHEDLPDHCTEGLPEPARLPAACCTPPFLLGALAAQVQLSLANLIHAFDRLTECKPSPVLMSVL